jgi:uncharacterized protein
MAGFEGNTVTTADGLAALYAKPTERILKKDLDYVNAPGRAFIAASPFLVLATGSQQGLDCSPKGDNSWRFRMMAGRCSYPIGAAIT